MKKPLLFISAVLLQAANCILPTISCAQKIAGGGYHSLTICGDSTVMGWGANNIGQLGSGFNNIDSIVPVPVGSISKIISLAAGSSHSLALVNDSIMWAWGDGFEGELGNGTNFPSDVPIEVSSLTNIIAIAAGVRHSLALMSDGTLWTFGYNFDGELGNGTNSNSNIPVQVTSLTNIIAMAGGGSHSLALESDSSVWAWGSGSAGQLGNGNNFDSNVPAQVNSLTGVIAIKAGEVIGLCPLIITCNAPFTLIADTLIPHHYWGLNFAYGVQPLSYYWNWGDGTYDTVAYPSHTYANAGLYTICLSIHDSTGCTDSVCVDYSVQKLSAENTIVTVDVVESIPTAIIQTENVLQSWSIFPNPASGNSLINYTLSTPANVSIDLYDVFGNKLQQLVSEDQEQGEHNATLNAHKLVNGVYVLQIRAGDQVAEEKVVLLR